MPTLPFTIDAELLRELGERLVGKPHVALAELIKNSYDADATQVTIKLSPDQDIIEVQDDGHGMTYDDFRKFWMRIGTTHKDRQFSKSLNRPMTGSKGVGRLAVQFLARELKIITVSKNKSSEWLEATINWEDAIKVGGELTKVEVNYRQPTSLKPFEHGTLIQLSGLKDGWTEDSIGKLAANIWWLQPPFHSSSLYDSKKHFCINFESTQGYEKIFEEHMHAIKSIWIARLVGETVDGEVTLSLQFQGEQPTVHKYRIGNFAYNDGKFSKTINLNTARFEIRIYNLRGKQKFGIKVDEARQYFRKHGGVHVYDGGFRLPYYGLPTSDWLRLEYDHSHRKNMSGYFPKEIQVPLALHNLPTLGRVFGVVKVDTSQEPNLKIMITRDRLTETTAYEDLRSIVRYAIDWYANETAKRKIEEKKREGLPEPTSLKFERVEQVLEHYKSEIPKNIYQEIYQKVQDAATSAQTNQELVLEQMGLIAPLATAGISALSYQHELKKQFAYIEDTIAKMKDVQSIDTELKNNLNSLSEELASWLKRAKATNLLFDYIADADNIQLQDRRLYAKRVIKEITEQISFLARDININYSQLDDRLLLPQTSFAAWGAIFQNIFINAFNAMLDSSLRLLHISSRSYDKTREILIQDTGYGINLNNAENLFKPFERESKISPERKALGYGGSGLGLTIVRLLAENIGCRVRFVKPEKGFKTAFSVRWREDK
jgi:signal transduction histidine kinase